MTIRRVLHLVTPSAPGCGASMLRLLGLTRRATPEFEHRVLLLGPASASDLALAAGAGAHHRLPPLFGAPRLSARGIRRAIAAESADLVHVWDSESCAIVIGGHPHEAVAATLGAVPPRAMPTPLAQDRAEAICIGERARHQALAAGWLHARVHATPPPSESSFHIEPESRHGAAPQTSRADRRAALRTAWNVDDATVIVGVIGDPWTAIDGKLAFDMVGRVWLAGHRVRLVLDPCVAAVAELRRWADSVGVRDVLIETPLATRPWEIFDALDAVMLPEAVSPKVWRRSSIDRAPGGAPSSALAALWAIDYGLPAISTRDGPLEGLAAPEQFVAVDRTPNAGARVLRELKPMILPPDTRASAEQQSHDGSNTHTDARAARSSGTWAEVIRSLYRRAAIAAGLPRVVESSAIAASR